MVYEPAFSPLPDAPDPPLTIGMPLTNKEANEPVAATTDVPDKLFTDTVPGKYASPAAVNVPVSWSTSPYTVKLFVLSTSTLRLLMTMGAPLFTVCWYNVLSTVAAMEELSAAIGVAVWLRLEDMVFIPVRDWNTGLTYLPRLTQFPSPSRNRH